MSHQVILISVHPHKFKHIVILFFYFNNSGAEPRTKLSHVFSNLEIQIYIFFLHMWYYLLYDCWKRWLPIQCNSVQKYYNIEESLSYTVKNEYFHCVFFFHNTISNKLHQILKINQILNLFLVSEIDIDVKENIHMMYSHINLLSEDCFFKYMIVSKTDMEW